MAFLKTRNRGVPLNRLRGLFDYTFNRAKKGDAKGHVLAPKLFSRLSLPGTKDAKTREIRRLLNRLLSSVEDFLVERGLKERPALRNMLLAEAVKLHGGSEPLKSILREWRKSIEEMPIGTWRLYQRWRYEDAVHFNPDQSKMRVKHGNLSATQSAMQTFTEFYREFYEAEKLNRLNIVNQEREWSPPHPVWEDRVLVNLYGTIHFMLRLNQFRANLFDHLFDLLEANYARLDPYHRATVFAFLKNYITIWRRRGETGTELLFKRCIELTLTPDFLRDNPGLTCASFTARMTEAVIAGDMDLVRRVKQRLLPQVLVGERAVAERLADVRIAFQEENHQKVVELTTTNLEGVSFSGYHELVPLKSMQIRSLLVLHQSGEGPDLLFDKVTGSLRKLVKENPDDFEGKRKDEQILFILVCQQLFREDLFSLSQDRYDKLRQRILTEEVIASRKWLRCFLAHFNPALPSRPANLWPTRNMGQPWV